MLQTGTRIARVENMDSNARKDTWFQSDIFEKTHEEISTLKARLPEDAVVSLAAEVIRRVSSRANTLTINAPHPSPEQIEHLARALISKEEAASTKLVLDAKSGGMEMETIYLHYLAGAARLLGAWWGDNKVSLVEVTLGTGRIYAILRASNRLFFPTVTFNQKSAVFAACPNETHTLGVRMAADLFRKDGWDIDLMIGQSHDELVENIEKSHHYLIGLSSGGRHSSGALARLIIALRLSKPKALIMLSGQIVNEAEDIVSVLDVDGIANDFETAQAVLEELWDRLDPSAQKA